jgi:hypothetical protein
MAFNYSCRFEKQGLGIGTDNNRAKNTCTLVSQVWLSTYTRSNNPRNSTVFSQTFQFECESPTIVE